MNKKLISAVIIAVSAPVIAYFISEDIRCMRYLKDPEEVVHKQIASIDMNERDRMKDFDTLWKVVSDGIPAVMAYPDEFGYDVRKSEERYRSAVENASSDVEFMCVMQSVLNDVPSTHTGFFFPDYKLVTDYNCMAAETVKTDPSLRSMTELWNKEMKHYYRQSRAYQFDYVDGKYCLTDNSEVKLPDVCCTLKSVNGVSPDEFILNNLSSSSLGYDEEHRKLYRRTLVFNESRGEKAELEVENEDGTVTRTEVYIDLCDEYMFVNQPYLHGVYEEPEGVYDIRYLDEDEKIVYFRLDDLDNDKGDVIAKKINEYCTDGTSVILDLRKNGGGTVEYTADHLYAPLFAADQKVNETEYILKSSGNREFFGGVYYFMNLKAFDMKKLSSDEAADVAGYLKNRKVFAYDVNADFKGSDKNEHFVCVLVSDRTGSAADYFVSAVKPMENVVVIGENTAGEKTGGQFLAMLPESRLVYYYSASVCLNPDGTDNSLYGTEPEIRCRQSIGGYYKRMHMLSELKDADKPENRLEWDDVLKNAYYICKNR